MSVVTKENKNRGWLRKNRKGNNLFIFIFKYVFVLKDLKFKFKFKFLKKKPNKQINKSIYMYEKLCFQA